MSSANDHLPPPPKPRMSPLEFRNTDLVSRLLAATPPYLYNMSLLPNTYFFSEMLRSIVQAKAERNAQTLHPPMRRSRKRNWTTSRTETVSKASTEVKSEEKPDVSSDWMLKSNKKLGDNPLELTKSKAESLESNYQQNKIEQFTNKTDSILSEFGFPHLTPTFPQETNPQNLVLPPPPPMWYPPLYPTAPYGIDPLHFFIDLRVSGHIYDKKNQKDNNNVSPTESFSGTTSRDKPHTEISPIKNENVTIQNSFRQTRHCSAFSVPSPNYGKNLAHERDTKSTKFDVKSMGFDKSENRVSTNYVMNNIANIYSNIGHARNDSFNGIDTNEENAEESEKKMKDLRAMIGLELVVDYVKPKTGKGPEEDSSSSTDVESIGSPALEVVAVNDEN